MRVVILERNKLVGRRVARLFAAAGASVTNLDEPGEIGEADVLCADAFDGDFVAEHARAGRCGVLWTAEPLKRSMKYLVESPISHVIGRKDFESAPRPWEVTMLARRLVSPGSQPPFAAYLDWGAAIAELDVRTSAEVDPTIAKIQELVLSLALPRRLAELVGELAHELIMNAMYDAPVDAEGKAKYAADRKSSVTLEEAERVLVRCGTDGTRFAISVRDPFGRLERRHVVDGLARGLAGGEQDRTHGGAGLGMLVAHNASTALVFDVARGRSTEVTALLELDLNLRELRTQARSLHVWSH